MPWRRRIMHELPLLCGLVAAWFLCWWNGRVFVRMVWPGGFDWERYLRETWAYFHPGTMNSTWLEPLYPWALGNLGDVVGWAWAGQLISGVALLAIVGGAALLGRALGGPWAGALAALAIPLNSQLAASGRWVNMYPLLSAFTALGLAGLVAFCRWPRWHWAVLGGVGVGLAWGVDSRTITLLPGFAVLLGLGLWGVKGRVRQVALAAVVLAGMALGPLTQSALRVVPREATSDVAVILRGIELSKVRQGQDDGWRAACDGAQATVISPGDLLHPCAAAFEADNLPRVDSGLPFGLMLSLLFLPLALLPGRGGLRRSLIAAFALLPMVAMTWVMCRWIIVTPRYMMQVAAPASVLIPVGTVQLALTLSRSVWAGRLAAGLCLAWLTWLVPEEAPEPLEASSTYGMMSALVQRIEVEVGPQDVLLDCSESHVEVSVLPRSFHPPPTNHEGHAWSRCGQWISQPAAVGDAYVITGDRTQVPGISAQGLPAPWVRVIHSQGMGQSVSLWRYGTGR